MLSLFHFIVFLVMHYDHYFQHLKIIFFYVVFTSSLQNIIVIFCSYDISYKQTIWKTNSQQKALIDRRRRYPLPVIYLTSLNLILFKPTRQGFPWICKNDIDKKDLHHFAWNFCWVMIEWIETHITNKPILKIANICRHYFWK